jgi:hypothetical protein
MDYQMSIAPYIYVVVVILLIFIFQMCKKVSKYISITSWNVNGLYRRSNGERLCKLDDDSVHTFMKSDIVCLSETHATKQDILKYEGYKCYTSWREYFKMSFSNLSNINLSQLVLFV